MCAVCVLEARADLDANVKRCRSDTVRIGEDPKSPYEQYVEVPAARFWMGWDAVETLLPGKLAPTSLVTPEGNPRIETRR